MPNVTLSIKALLSDLPSPRLRRLGGALQRMARSLDEMYDVQLASGRYERATDEYEEELLNAYQTWVRKLIKTIGKEKDLVRASQVVTELMPDLLLSLQALATEFLPDAVNAMSDAYVPSPDAFFLIGNAILQNNADLETRLIPAIEEKLQRAVLDGTPVQSAADSMNYRVSAYAGAYWVLIQRFIGDFAAQAESADDQVYECEWVCVGDDNSCESCLKFRGKYASYNAMLEKTFECVPGYFQHSPYRSCWSFCRCYLRLLINGTWKRV